MIELLTSAEAWAALLTLTALEIVLGIDNVIFLSVIVSRIPPDQAKRARQIGLLLALVFRIVLLSVLVWLIGLTEPVLTVTNIALSWRDIILIGGGLFLIAKATHEIHAEVEASNAEADATPKTSAFFWETYMMTQAITTAAIMISRSCAMPIAVMIESSENTMSMTMICTITQKNALALPEPSELEVARLDLGVDFVHPLGNKNSPPPIRMMSRQDSATLFTVRTGSVNPISQTKRLSRMMRNTSASSRPIWRARLACSGGIRETITDRKMTLSMPSTISSAVSRQQRRPGFRAGQ